MYVKWFDTVMFYYVILVNLVNVTFCHFQIFCRSVPVRPDARREWNPEDRCRHLLDYIAGDTAGGTSRERKDEVSEEQIPEQRSMVNPSVARGYRLCYTQEYRQGG
ncbi:unnamed protein product [Staurois parvus]|uniref:Uncharacterized protein n=1 Tax=Staurois parvus TaxID=386267 RepID=A0ABN9CGA1_9NEOB|nr:unnamed protein product [Staurois parvus]